MCSCHRVTSDQSLGSHITAHITHHKTTSTTGSECCISFITYITFHSLALTAGPNKSTPPPHQHLSGLPHHRFAPAAAPIRFNMWKLGKKQSSDGNNALPTRVTKQPVNRISKQNPLLGIGFCMQRLCSHCTFFAYQQFSKTVLKNPWYRCCLILFTLVLLTGSAIQFICFDGTSSDKGFDILYIITFCFLAYDTVMRSCVDPTYGFACAMKSKRYYLKWYQKMGGLLFWCDVASCITLLLEISTVSFFDASGTIEITVNEFGAPVSLFSP